MGTTARLNIGESGAMGAVRGFLATLLEHEEAQAVLVPRHGGNTVMPSLVSDPQALQSADPFSPLLSAQRGQTGGQADQRGNGRHNRGRAASL